MSEPNKQLIFRTAIQLERTAKIRSMLALDNWGATPRYTTEDIVKAISEWDVTWDDEFKRKGLNEVEAYRRKIISVQRMAQTMRNEGTPCGFLSRQPGQVAFKHKQEGIMKQALTKMEVSKIVGWFKSPNNIARLSWSEREEIIQQIQQQSNNERK